MKSSIKVGFWIEDQETKPGVFKSTIAEKPYICEILKNNRSFQSSEQQNDNLVLNNTISLLSDFYLQKNWHSIKYVVWNNVKWKAKSIDISVYPRVKIELGGIYNA